MNMKAIVGIDPKTKRCEIAATNSPENWDECRRHGYIVVPTTMEKARIMWGEVVVDLWELGSSASPEVEEAGRGLLRMGGGK